MAPVKAAAVLALAGLLAAVEGFVPSFGPKASVALRLRPGARSNGGRSSGHGRGQALRMSGTPNVLTKDICGSQCIGQNWADQFADLMGPGYKAVVADVGQVRHA